MKIEMVSVIVNDPVEAFKFYTETLGFVERLYMPEAQLAIVASPEEPDSTGVLLEPSDNPIGKRFQQAVYNAEMPIIVFGVSDIQREYQRLKARGVVFKKEPTKADSGIEAVFDDTCGNLIQIVQMN